MSIKIPSDEDLDPRTTDESGVMVTYSGGDEDSPRDTTQPVSKDAAGNLLYAPLGVTFRL